MDGDHQGIKKFIVTHLIQLVLIAAACWGGWVAISKDVGDLKIWKAETTAKLASVASAKEIEDLKTENKAYAERITRVEQAVDSVGKSAERIERAVDDLRAFLLNRGRRGTVE